MHTFFSQYYYDNKNDSESSFLNAEGKLNETVQIQKMFQFYSLFQL